MSSNGNALEGWTAGRWQVERRLRRGKVADAFKVRGPEGEGRVLRLLHPVHVVDARAIARCLDEAKALLYPPHPEIVPVEDAGQLPDGRVYLVAEDSELPLHLDLHPQPRPDELVRMAEQLAPALDALHARSLLHGHLEVDSLVGEPLRLSGVGFGVFQGGTTQEWTGGRDPGRRDRPRPAPASRARLPGFSRVLPAVPSPNTLFARDTPLAPRGRGVAQRLLPGAEPMVHDAVRAEAFAVA